MPAVKRFVLLLLFAGVLSFTGVTHISATMIIFLKGGTVVDVPVNNVISYLTDTAY
jgi:hypothetical protein